MDILKNKIQIILTLLYLAYAIWWLSFQSVVNSQGVSVQRFGATYGVIAFLGAIVGFVAAFKWGGFKTVTGKALMLFSLGLLAQEAGQIIYTYYIYGAKIQIPYPSWGDLAYFGSVLLYICATVYLGKASGVKFTLKNKWYKVVAAIIFAVIISLSYWFLLRDYEFDTSKPLTVFLDFGYPMGQAVYIALAITAYLLSHKLLGGKMRTAILLVILALVIQYTADFTFIYQSHKGTWLTGRINDFTYLTAYFVMATAMIKFNVVYDGLKRRSKAKG